MPTPSSLQETVEQLLPQLSAEIGETQDEVRRANRRLGRVPDALLQSGSKAALVSAMNSLDQANDYILICLQKLYEQYPKAMVNRTIDRQTGKPRPNRAEQDGVLDDGTEG